MNDLEQAQKEYEKVTDWVLSEESKVEDKLKKEGRWRGGLDTHNEDFAYIYQERNRRIKAIREKYGLAGGKDYGQND
ncbi:MAG: hypothetical protein LUE87_02470 [Lachnospiraceae bacterium]|nr:hypothetical protein [Lachnospiraceae bacterium]